MIDLAPLNRALPAARFWRALPGARQPWYASAVVVTAGAGLAVAATGVAAAGLLSGARASTRLLAIIPVLWAVGVVAAYAVWALRRLRARRIAWFAEVNDLPYVPIQENLHRKGLGFPHHLRSVERNVIRTTVPTRSGPKVVTLGQHVGLASRGTRTADVRKPFAFIEIRLTGNAPHLMLKNRRARILPLWGVSRGTSQRITLEGDFDDTLTLFCPREFLIVALSVFTPDVVEAILRFAPKAEIEFVDEMVYIYLDHRTRFWRAGTMAEVLGMAARLADRFDRRTTRIGTDADMESEPLASARVRDSREPSGRTVLWSIVGVTTIAGFTVTSLLLAPLWFSR